MMHHATLKPRRGVALVMALALMAVLTVVLAVVTIEVVSERQVIHNRQRRLQAAWLARSGAELAAARLLQSSDTFKAVDDKLLTDTKVSIIVEKSGTDLYTVSSDAEVGPPEEKLTTATASVQFRRVESAGGIRLQALPMVKK